MPACSPAQGGRTRRSRPGARPPKATPYLVENWLRLARLVRNRGDREEALRLMDIGLAISPADPDLLTAKGNLLRRMERWEEAREPYARALIHGARDPHPHNGLGMIALYHDKAFAAAEHFTRAIERAPETVRYVYWRAAARNAGHDCGALPDFRSYLARCSAGEKCAEANLAYARQALGFLPGLCTEDGERK